MKLQEKNQKDREGVERLSSREQGDKRFQVGGNVDHNFNVRGKAF